MKIFLALPGITVAVILFWSVPARPACDCLDYGQFAQVVYVFDHSSSDISASDGRLFATNYSYTPTEVIGYDPTAPGGPVELGRTTVPPLSPVIRDVIARDDTWLYVVMAGSGWTTDSLMVYDAAAGPTFPIVHSISIPDLVDGSIVSGNYCYLPGTLSLSIVDATLPSSPSLVTTVPLAETATGVAVESGYAYLATPSGIVVVDVDPPASAAVVGSTVPALGRGVAVHGGYAYVPNVSNGLTVLDLNPPTAPVIVATLPEFVGEYATVVDGVLYTTYPLRRLDLSNPTSPTGTGAIETRFQGEIAVVSGSAFARVEGSSINQLAEVDFSVHSDLAVPCSAPFVGASDPGPAVVVGNTLFYMLTNATQGGVNSWLMAMDVSDPSSPTTSPLPAASHSGRGAGLAADFLNPGSGILCDVSDSTLYAWDVSDPNNRLIVGQLPLGFRAESVALQNGLAYVVGYTGVRVVDLSVPSAPVSRYFVTFAADDIVLSGNLAYMLNRTTGVFRVMDFSDLDAPIFGWVTTITQPTAGFDVSGSHAYVATVDSGDLRVYDLSDPTMPLFLTTVPGPFQGVEADAIDAEGDVIAVRSVYGTLFYDASVSALPQYSGGVWHGRAYWPGGPVISDDFVWAPGENAESFLLPKPCAAAPVRVDEKAAAPLSWELRPGTPNPFRTRTEFLLTSPSAGEFRVRVLDVRGRVVQVLADGTLEAGVTTIRWDGVDARGSLVTPGVYFLEVNGPGGRTTRKSVRLR